jgi:hypothetical protein
MPRQFDYTMGDPDWWRVLEHHTEIPPKADEGLKMACSCACGLKFGAYGRYNDHLLEIAREEIKALKRALAEERE